MLETVLLAIMLVAFCLCFGSASFWAYLDGEGDLSFALFVVFLVLLLITYNFYPQNVFPSRGLTFGLLVGTTIGINLIGMFLRVRREGKLRLR